MEERGTNGLSAALPGKEPPERALGGVEEQYRVLMECVSDYAIFFIDAHGQVATARPAATNTTSA